MRYWEMQPQESNKAYAAFQIYRDLGTARSLAKCAETYYGSIKNLAQMGVWSTKFDWVRRVGQYDAWLDMVAHGAIEDHERARSSDHAKRRDDLRLRSFENEERAALLETVFLGRLETSLEDLPVIRTTVEETDEDGRPVIYRMYPATPNADLTVQRLHKIATRAEPTKLALTDPAGEHEHGRSAEEIDREFEEAFGESFESDEERRQEP